MASDMKRAVDAAIAADNRVTEALTALRETHNVEDAANAVEKLRTAVVVRNEVVAVVKDVAADAAGNKDVV